MAIDDIIDFDFDPKAGMYVPVSEIKKNYPLVRVYEKTRQMVVYEKVEMQAQTFEQIKGQYVDINI